MVSLEDTVRSVVQDLMSRGVLFTALDVSNTVKQQLPHVKHREVRDTVRSMYSTDIESQNWARTPITVTLGDGTTAEALLYHPLTDSWDLDNKYSTQQRAQTSFRPVAAAQTTVAQAQATMAQAQTVVSTPASVPVSSPARSMWDNLFQTQPSLFPRR